MPKAETVIENSILMERSNCGLTVQLLYDGAFVAIRVIDGDEMPQSKVIHPQDAMEAFNHPFVYLP